MISVEARGAWKELETRLRPYVARRVGSAADIDDVLQEIFVRMHRGLGELRDDQRFGGWVYRIAHSVVVDRARARARRPVVALSEDMDVASELTEADAAEDAVLADALGACTAAFVAQLASPYRDAIMLTELQGMPQKAAAARLGVSVSGIKSRVQRGREKLRDMFEECCQIAVDARGKVRECEPDSSSRRCGAPGTPCAGRERSS